MALGRLLEGFITILIGVNLIPSVADQISTATSGNVTGSSATILNLVTLFFALGIMIAGVNIAVGENNTFRVPPYLEATLHSVNPNIGSTSIRKNGQDRSVKHKNYALETDKGNSFFEFEIQSEPITYIKDRSEVEMTSPLGLLSKSNKMGLQDVGLI